MFMYYNGQVRDNETSGGIPGASVVYTYQGQNVGGQAANGQGYFAINTSRPADTVTVSSAGYLFQQFPVYGNQQHTFDLERDPKQLPPVVITAHKKKKWLAWAALLGLIFLMKKK